MPRSKHVNLEPIILSGDDLAYWVANSKLIGGISNGDEPLILKYNDMVRPPGGSLDWQFFRDLVEGNNVFSLESSERKNVVARAARSTPRQVSGIDDIIARETSINDIDFDRSQGYSRGQALTFLDYLGYKRPETMLVSLFRDFGESSPVLGHMNPSSRRKPVATRRSRPRPHPRVHSRYYRRSRNSNEVSLSSLSRDTEAERRNNSREFRSEELGRHAAAAKKFLGRTLGGPGSARGTRAAKKAQRATKRR